MLRKFLASVFLMFFPAVTSFAAHPLVTDDTGTQGKENFSWRLTANLPTKRKQRQG